jgi:uncharacterized protein (TIGR02996 family)
MQDPMENPDFKALLNTVIAYPESQAPKLVLSDWLEERNDEYPGLWQGWRWIGQFNREPKATKQKWRVITDGFLYTRPFFRWHCLRGDLFKLRSDMLPKRIWQNFPARGSQQATLWPGKVVPVLAGPSAGWYVCPRDAYMELAQTVAWMGVTCEYSA